MWRIIHWYWPQFMIWICQNCRTAYQSWDWKSLTSSRSLWCSLLRGIEKIQLYFRQWKAREREGCWYTKTICMEDQPWQHYSSSVEWRYPGSCVTLPVLHHSSHILLKAHYCWSMLPLSQPQRNDLLESNILGPKPAQFSIVKILHWCSWRWPIMTE